MGQQAQEHGGVRVPRISPEVCISGSQELEAGSWNTAGSRQEGWQMAGRLGRRWVEMHHWTQELEAGWTARSRVRLIW